MHFNFYHLTLILGIFLNKDVDFRERSLTSALVLADCPHFWLSKLLMDILTETIFVSLKKRLNFLADQIFGCKSGNLRIDYVYLHLIGQKYSTWKLFFQLNFGLSSHFAFFFLIEPHMLEGTALDPMKSKILIFFSFLTFFPQQILINLSSNYGRKNVLETFVDASCIVSVNIMLLNFNCLKSKQKNA